MVDTGTSITLPDVVNVANAPPPPVVSTLQALYARRKIDVTFRLGMGDFGAAGADQLTLTGLRVYAHLQGVGSPHMSSEAIIRIYGMSLDHMNAVSKAGLLFDARQNFVQVDAGDEVSGMTTVN